MQSASPGSSPNAGDDHPILSFRKGLWILGLIGFFFPVVWLVGAILPARRLR
jgi:hypothetical protein